MASPATGQPSVLVLGASGMLGHKLVQVLSPRFETNATARRLSEPTASLPGVDHARVIEGVVAEDIESVAAAIQSVRPDVIVNCIGIVKQLPTANDPVAAITVNALFPHQVAGIAAVADARLIHISTDCVFSGRRGDYREDDVPDADDLYGRSKLLGEATSGRSLTLRTSIIGRELSGAHGLLEWFLSQDGGSVSGYRKAIFSGLTTLTFAQVIAHIVEREDELSGLYHVAAAPIAKLDLLESLRDAYNLDVEIVPDDSLVIDRSLDGSRFDARTNIQLPSWDAMIGELAADPTPYEALRGVGASR